MSALHAEQGADAAGRGTSSGGSIPDVSDGCLRVAVEHGERFSFGCAPFAVASGVVLIGVPVVGVTTALMNGNWEAISIFVAMGLLAAGIVSILVGIALWRGASAPRDLVLDERGFRVEGLRTRANEALWSAVQELKFDPGLAMPPVPAPLAGTNAQAEKASPRLVAKIHDAERELFAKRDVPVDDDFRAMERSLGGIRPPDKCAGSAGHDAFRSAWHPQNEPSRPLVPVPRCESCGAEQEEWPDWVGRCPSCGGEVRLTDVAIARVQVVQNQRVELPAGLSWALHHPTVGAPRAWVRAVTLMVVPSCGAVLAALLVGWTYFYANPGKAALSCGMFLILATAALSVGANSAALPWQVAREVIGRFAALGSENPGGAPRCRVCRAPLLGADETHGVACVSCDAENVLAAEKRPYPTHEKGSESLQSCVNAWPSIGNLVGRWTGVAALAGAALVAQQCAANDSVTLRPQGNRPPPERLTSVFHDERIASVDRTGRKLLFVRVSNYADEENPRGTIYEQPIGGNAARRTDSAEVAFDPAWTSGGQDFLYARQSGADPSVHELVLCSPTGAKKVLASGRGLRHPSPSRDDSLVAYAQEVAPGESWTYLISLKEPGAPRALWKGSQPAFSPTDERIAFVLHSQVRIADSPRPEASSRVLQLSDFSSLDPAWSPDGSKVVFVSDRATDRWGRPTVDKSQLQVVMADEKGWTKLTAGTSRCRHPVWGNDGWVYFESDGYVGIDILRTRP